MHYTLAFYIEGAKGKPYGSSPRKAAKNDPNFNCALGAVKAQCVLFSFLPHTSSSLPLLLSIR
jgi:hypothetical protein